MGDSSMKLLRIAGVIAMSVVILRAEDFTLKYFGDGPVMLHTTLTFEGKGERLVATAKNESGSPIQKARICIASASLKKGCLFEVWNTGAWAPGAELSWSVTSAIRVTDLSHDAMIEEYTAVEKSPSIALTAGTTPPACSAYFGVLQDDPRAPGRYVARMTNAQADWFQKTGGKQYPGLCLSLERARYLIVWTVSTEARTIHETVNRTAQANTSTTGTENGTFSTYGSLSTWGTYSGHSSSSSTTSVTTQETVPVSMTTDHCYIYVLKSVGSTIWDDIHNKVPQPLTFFSTETRGGNKVTDTGGANALSIALGSAISRAVRGDPTMHALEASLKFISAQPPDAVTASQLRAPQAMGNAEVVQLRSAGISDQVIVEAVNNAASVRFEPDAPHIIDLNKAGVSDDVIQAMLRRSKPQ